MNARRIHPFRLQWIPLAALFAILCAGISCGGPEFATATQLPDANADIDAAEEFDNRPIVLCNPCDMPAEAGVDSGDATVEGSAGDSTVEGGAGDSTVEGDAGGGAEGTINSTADARTGDGEGSARDAADEANLSACTGGGSCTPSECQHGIWVCVDAGRVCQPMAAVDAGTACFTAQHATSASCDGLGSCKAVTCNTGFVNDQGACKVPGCAGVACGGSDGAGGICTGSSGTCGAAGQHCNGAGQCVCDGTSCAGCCDGSGTCHVGLATCNGACVDEQSDKANCGACGNGCAISCAGGQCVVATAIAAGFYNTCARLSDGTVRCWGANNLGQLGPSGTANALNPMVINASSGAPLSGVNAIAAGFGYECAIHADTTIDCWGYNQQGELGQGTFGGPVNFGVPTPAPVLDGTGSKLSATAIAAGLQDSIDHTCAVISGGAVACWGTNASGELGNGSAAGNFSGVAIPQSVLTSAGPALMGATAVAVGESHSCALLAGGSIDCWGDDFVGQLGNRMILNDGGPSSISTAGPVLTLSGTALTGASALAAANNQTCAIATGGSVVCWGVLATGGTSATPTAVLLNGAPLTGATAITVGLTHACAVLAGGTVSCWGTNPDGELGNGTTVSSTAPVPVTTAPGVPLTGAVAVSAGAFHTCALLTGGTVSCWGRNGIGELGNGTPTSSLNPVTVVW
jgi:Regulator of Chromosome Condensation (RCC1) repeat protein